MYKVYVVDSSGILIASYPPEEKLSMMSNLIMALRQFSKEIFGKPFSMVQIEDLYLLAKDTPEDVTVVLLASTKDEAFLQKVSVIVSEKIREFKKNNLFVHGLVTPEVEKELTKTLEKAFYYTPPYGLVYKIYKMFSEVPLPMTPPIVNKWMKSFELNTEYINSKLKNIRNEVDLAKARECLEYIAKRNMVKAFEYAVDSGCIPLAIHTGIFAGITIGSIPTYAMPLMDKISDKDIKYFLMNEYNYFYGEPTFIMPYPQMAGLMKKFVERINLDTPEGISIASFFLPAKVTMPIPDSLKDYVSPLELEVSKRWIKLYQAYKELLATKAFKKEKYLELLSHLIELLKDTQKYVKTTTDKAVYVSLLIEALSTFTAIVEDFNVNLEEAKDVASFLIKTLEKNLKNIEKVAYVGISLQALSDCLLGAYICMRILGKFNKKILNTLLRLVIPYFYPYLEKKRGKMLLLNGVMLQHTALTLKEERIFKSGYINSMFDALLSKPILDKNDIFNLFGSSKSKNIEFALWCLESYVILLMRMANKLPSEIRNKVMRKLKEFDDYLNFELKKIGVKSLFFELEKASLYEKI